MNELFSWPALATAVLTATFAVWWLHRRGRDRRRSLRQAGYRLIHALKTYSAWVESMRVEPFLPSEPEEAAAAAALQEAHAIIQASFPALSAAMLRLLRSDSELMWRIWQQQLPALRDSGVSPAQYLADCRRLRAGQEDLVDELIARCQVLMGERDRAWRSSDMDSEFPPSFSSPPSAA